MLSQAAEDLLARGRQEGRQEGALTQARQMLKHLLTRRFPDAASVHLARIDAADQAALDLWFDRALDAGDLDAIFAERP